MSLTILTTYSTVEFALRKNENNKKHLTWTKLVLTRIWSLFAQCLLVGCGRKLHNNEQTMDFNITAQRSTIHWIVENLLDWEAWYSLIFNNAETGFRNKTVNSGVFRMVWKGSQVSFRFPCSELQCLSANYFSLRSHRGNRRVQTLVHSTACGIHSPFISNFVRIWQVAFKVPQTLWKAQKYCRWDSAVYTSSIAVSSHLRSQFLHRLALVLESRTLKEQSVR